MSFCPFCGKELSEEEGHAKFCPYCGKPLNADPEQASGNAVEGSQPQQEKNPVFDVDDIKAKVMPVAEQISQKAKTLDKKYYPVVIAVPVLLIAFIIVIALATSDSYMKPLNDFIKLANKEVADTQKYTYALSPDFRVSLYKKIDAVAVKSDSYQDALEDTNDALADNFDEINDEFDKWKIKFEVKSKEKLDKDDLEELNETYEDYYDEYIDSIIDKYEDALDDDDELEDYADQMDLSEKDAAKVLKAYINYYKSYKDIKITAAYEVKGKFIVETDDDTYKTETVKLTFVKVNGDWAYAGCNGSLTLKDSDGYFDFIMRYLKTSYLKR